MPQGREVDYAALAREAAERYGIRPELFIELIRQESSFDPGAASSAGAVGLGQLMPETAKELGVSDRLDPYENLDASARYLQQQLERFEGDERMALGAYNAGPTRVERLGRVPDFPETQNYVNTVYGRSNPGEQYFADFDAAQAQEETAGEQYFADFDMALAQETQLPPAGMPEIDPFADPMRQGTPGGVTEEVSIFAPDLDQHILPEDAKGPGEQYFIQYDTAIDEQKAVEELDLDETPGQDTTYEALTKALKRGSFDTAQMAAEVQGLFEKLPLPLRAAIAPGITLPGMLPGAPTAEEAMAIEMPEDWMREGEYGFGLDLKVAAVESVPQLILQIGASMTGVTPVAFGTAALAEGRGAYKEAVAAGASQKEAIAAAGLTGFTNGLLEYVPLGRTLARIGKASKGSIKEWGQNIVKSTLEEGFTGTAQQLAGDINALATYAAKEGFGWEELKEMATDPAVLREYAIAAGAEALLGSTVSTVGGAGRVAGAAIEKGQVVEGQEEIRQTLEEFDRRVAEGQVELEAEPETKAAPPEIEAELQEDLAEQQELFKPEAVEAPVTSEPEPQAPAVEAAPDVQAEAPAPAEAQPSKLEALQTELAEITNKAGRAKAGKAVRRKALLVEIEEVESAPPTMEDLQAELVEITAKGGRAKAGKGPRKKEILAEMKELSDTEAATAAQETVTPESEAAVMKAFEGTTPSSRQVRKRNIKKQADFKPNQLDATIDSLIEQGKIEPAGQDALGERFVKVFTPEEITAHETKQAKESAEFQKAEDERAEAERLDSFKTQPTEVMEPAQAVKAMRRDSQGPNKERSPGGVTEVGTIQALPDGQFGVEVKMHSLFGGAFGHSPFDYIQYTFASKAGAESFQKSAKRRAKFDAKKRAEGKTFATEWKAEAEKARAEAEEQGLEVPPERTLLAEAEPTKAVEDVPVETEPSPLTEGEVRAIETVKQEVRDGAGPVTMTKRQSIGEYARLNVGKRRKGGGWEATVVSLPEGATEPVVNRGAFELAADMDRFVALHEGQAQQGAGIPEDRVVSGAEAQRILAAQDQRLGVKPKKAKPKRKPKKEMEQSLLDFGPEEGGFIRIGKDKSEPERDPETQVFEDDPEAQVEWDKARTGVVRTWRTRFKSFTQQHAPKMVRVHAKLKPGGETVVASEALRRVQNAADVASEKVARLMTRTYQSLDARQQEVLDRAWALENARVLYELDGPDTKLFPGLTPDKVADKLADARAQLARPENRAVRQSMTEIQEAFESARDELAAALEPLGVNVGKRPQDAVYHPETGELISEAQEGEGLWKQGEWYMHHQVLEFAMDPTGEVTGGRLKAAKSHYLYQRKGTDKPYNLNFLQAQSSVLARMLADAERGRQLQRIGNEYNAAEQFQAEAGKMNAQHKKDGTLPTQKGVEWKEWTDVDSEGQERDRITVKWQSLLPDDYALFNPGAHMVFFRVHTVDKTLLEAVMDGTAELTQDSVKEMLAAVPNPSQWALPLNIAETLTEQSSQERGPVMQVVQNLHRRFKIMALTAPWRVFKYLTRNFVSDTNKTFIGNPRAMLRMREAYRELEEYLYDTTGAVVPSENLQAYLDLGGTFSQSLHQEIAGSTAQREAEQKRWDEDSGSILDNLESFSKTGTSRYTKFMRKRINLLESVNRYANFLEYKGQLESKKGLRNYGASIPEEINSLPGVEDKAYRLANELIGAYDQITRMGQALRQSAIPFWSFQEINVRSHWRLMKNTLRDPQVGEKALGKFYSKKTLGRMARYAPGAALKAGSLAARLYAFEVMLGVWNHLPFNLEDEKKLSQLSRNRPHVIVPLHLLRYVPALSTGRVKKRDPKAEATYFDRLSVFSEFREWFGLEEFGPNLIIQHYLDGRISSKQLIDGMLYRMMPDEVYERVLGKTVASISPFIKLTFELPTGQTLYPKPTSPRPIQGHRFEHAVGSALSMGWGAGQLAGAVRSMISPVSKGGKERKFAAPERITPTYGPLTHAKRAFLYTQVAGQGAYWDVRDEIDRFRTDVMKTSKLGMDTSPKATALRDYKQSIRLDDYPAAAHALRKYLDHGGTRQGLKRSISSLSPAHTISKKWRKQFLEALGPDGKERLKEAFDYYQEEIVTPHRQYLSDFLKELQQEMQEEK